MHKIKKQVRLSPALFLILLFSGYAFATDKPYIEAIVSDAYPLTGINALQNEGIQVHIYNIDDGKRLLKAYAKHLPANQNKAKKTLEQQFKRLGNNVVKGQFMQAYQGIILGTRYQITRYPAIIFDHGKSVIYGVTDMEQAFKLYHQRQ